MTSIFIQLILMLLLFPAISCAATINTADYGDGTASRANVAAAIADATYGDTVTIPACAAGDCVWTSGIAITKNIEIVGDGSSSTYLTVGFTDNSVEEAFFKFTPDETSRANLDSLEDTATFSVSAIHFYKASAPRLAYKYGVWVNNECTPVVKRVRIHNNSFSNIHRAVQVIGYVHGLMDNNVLVNTNGSYPQGIGLAGWTNDVRAIGTEQAWYLEDNTFSFPDTTGIISGAANDGGSHVVRYNTFASGTGSIYVETHSNQSSSIKGGFHTEMYGNNFSGAASQGIDMRGGQSIIYNNVANDDTYVVREEFYDAYSGTLPGDWCTDSNYSTGSCVGACPQICTDACYCWKVNRSYFWGNRRTADGALQGFTIDYDRYDNVTGHNNNPAELVENREFYNQNASFDGTAGMGCGTAATMNAITTCTDGVGFWVPNATDDPTAASCSNLTGFVGASPTYHGKGTLYKCSSNTWDAYYTPYTYPHPLRDPGGTPYYTLTVTQPTRGTITTPEGINCGSGGSICTMEYESTASAVLTFTPDSQWRFSSASDDCAGTARGATCTLEMSAAKTAGATFVVQERVLWVQ